jgi:hypothetical protein
MPILIVPYIALIVCLHLLPAGGGALNRTAVGPVRADYLLHVLLFMPWMGLLCLRVSPRAGWRLERAVPGFGKALMWMALGMGLAIAAEGVHYWLPDRSFNPLDGLSNAAGVLLGTTLLLLPPTQNP